MSRYLNFSYMLNALWIQITSLISPNQVFFYLSLKNILFENIICVIIGNDWANYLEGLLIREMSYTYKYRNI